VKWLEMVQTGLPMTAASAVFGSGKLTWREKYILISEMIPWALKCGKNTVFLMNVWYEKHFEEDLDAFRTQLNFIPFSSSK